MMHRFPLGQLIVGRGYADEAAVIGALRMQHLAKALFGKHLFLGEVLVIQGKLRLAQLDELLTAGASFLDEATDGAGERHFGGVAVELGLLTEDRLAAALDEQRADLVDGKPRRLLGEILFGRGHLTRADVDSIVEKLVAKAP